MGSLRGVIPELLVEYVFYPIDFIYAKTNSTPTEKYTRIGLLASSFALLASPRNFNVTLGTRLKGLNVFICT